MAPSYSSHSRLFSRSPLLDLFQRLTLRKDSFPFREQDQRILLIDVREKELESPRRLPVSSFLLEVIVG